MRRSDGWQQKGSIPGRTSSERAKDALVFNGPQVAAEQDLLWPLLLMADEIDVHVAVDLQSIMMRPRKVYSVRTGRLPRNDKISSKLQC